MNVAGNSQTCLPQAGRVSKDLGLRFFKILGVIMLVTKNEFSCGFGAFESDPRDVPP
jgi:hypothetical protein